jgi:hypothetical protein
MRVKDISGQRFGRWTALAATDRRRSNGGVLWICRCDCGTVKEVSGGHLRGALKGTDRGLSCGCLRDELATARATTHGMYDTAEYNAYMSAKSRCTNPKRDCWDNYGGRGIEFRFRSFEEFIGDIGFKPSPELTLDRFPDNNGHYKVGNVRWATKKDQIANRRPTHLWKKPAQSKQMSVAMAVA